MTLETTQKNRRVVVTGMGLITPCGSTQDTFWQALVEGRSGIGQITLFDPQEYGCQIAGEITDFNPENYMEKKEARRMDRFMQFALAAAKEAYADANLSEEVVDPDRFSVVIGTGSGGIGTIEDQVKLNIANGPRRCSPFFVPSMLCDMASGRISIRYKAQGPNMAVVTACATGTDSIGNAFRMIQNDEADIAFAGGAEAPITPASLAGFVAARAMTRQFNDRPQVASRPFDVDRDGFVMGEGASILILETLEHAQKRGAKIYAELVGYGRSSDAYDIVSPAPQGQGAIKAMKAALRDASLSADAVDYINAHATSTPLGDLAESQAIRSVFVDGNHQRKHPILVNGTKSMTGHMIGAAGSTEAIISIMAIRNKLVPPTINVDNQDPECDLDVVPNQARKAEHLKVALSNSFGFGGHNASLIFKAWENN
jgi:3-oxoacyl-[acyl-carrier-protein] synthase II